MKIIQYQTSEWGSSLRYTFSGVDTYGNITRFGRHCGNIFEFDEGYRYEEISKEFI